VKVLILIIDLVEWNININYWSWDKEFDFVDKICCCTKEEFESEWGDKEEENKWYEFDWIISFEGYSDNEIWLSKFDQLISSSLISLKEHYLLMKMPKINKM
jgi:hypothetical protein